MLAKQAGGDPSCNIYRPQWDLYKNESGKRARGPASWEPREPRAGCMDSCPWFGPPINSGRKSRPRRRRPDRLECETFTKKRVTGRRFSLTHAWSREIEREQNDRRCAHNIAWQYYLARLREEILVAGSPVIRKWNCAWKTAFKYSRMLDFLDARFTWHDLLIFLFLLSHPTSAGWLEALFDSKYF